VVTGFETNNIDNMNNVKCDTKRHFRNKKIRNIWKLKLMSWQQTVILNFSVSPCIFQFN